MGIRFPLIFGNDVNMVRVGLNLRLVRVNIPGPPKGMEKREGKRRM